MALDIIGYNATFDAFVQFAETQHAAGKEKTVARFDPDAAKELGGIVDRTIKPGSGDWVGVGVGRLASLKRANNITREAFMNAVSNMFGGVDHIPDSVKDAMKLEDYGKGKPLTARRILAVAEAITKLDDAVLSDGFSKEEVAKMHNVANLYAEATGCSKVAAFIEASTPGSKANRLMNYGGRFLKTAENFKNGLELIDTFKEWFSDVGTELRKLDVNHTRTEKMNLTMLNAKVSSFVSDKLLGTEKFVFESIAHDPSFNLAERDQDRLFGMENNVATQFFGLGLNGSCTQTIAQIPPEKRNTLFSAVTLFYPLADNPINANEKPDMYGSLSSEDSPLMVARILRNFDKVAEMKANGTLTLENLVKLCFPELPENGECTVDEVRKIIDGMSGQITEAMKSGRLTTESYCQALWALSDTGCSAEEAIDSCTGGPHPQPPKYVSTGTLGLSAYDGTTKEGRQQLMTDLGRPWTYSYVWNRDKGLLPNDKRGFTFNFPGEPPVVTGESDEGKANIVVVCDKVESLCGKAHPAQASSVMTMLSQSGLGILRGGLSQYGLISNEHSACDFTLSKDAETGDVTIRYSSPEGLPFEFEWTATVRSDGFVTTTPFKFTDKRPPEQKLLNDLFISGNAAKKIGDIIIPGSGLEDVQNPSQELKNRMNNIATANVQTYAPRSIATMRTDGKGSGVDLNKYAAAFKEDLARRLPVSIGKGKPLYELGLEKARDSYVDFITDGKVKTYAEADKKTKIKACLLMAFSCQGFIICGLKGVSNAFDKNGNRARLMAGKGADERNRTDSLNLSKDKNGNFVIKSSTVFTSTSLLLTKENAMSEFYSTNEGSSLKYNLNVVVTADSLERFASANWDDFDSDANWNIENDLATPHSVERAADELPEDFKLDVKVDLSYSIDADGLAVRV